MSLTGKQFCDRLDQHFSPALAEEGDPVGLHVGTLQKPLSKIMVTLDVRPEVVAEAIAKKVDLIVAKHPPIFRPIKRLNLDDPQNQMYGDLIKHDIAVYAIHTNMDIVEDGLNDWLCESLELKETNFLTLTHEIPYLKLAVYIPNQQAHNLRKVLAKAGAGSLGAGVEKASYSSQGEGRYSRESVVSGDVEQQASELINETKVEVIFLETQQAKIMEVMRANHPYEEPVYDLFPLANHGKQFGLGRVGMLEQPQTLTSFIEKVKTTFKLEGLRVISNNPESLIQRVAICGGSGEKFYPDAVRANADVYITGDVSYHTAHDMLAANLSVIDAGHHIEVLCQERLLELCQQWQKEANWDVTFIQSEENTNPFNFY